MSSFDRLIAEEERLLKLIRRNASTRFGSEHSFGRIDSVRDFQTSVPIMSYEDYEPYIEMICCGEKSILTVDEVRQLNLTSGTSSASKLVPFTVGLQTEMRGAVSEWLQALFLHFPEIVSGPNFFVVSPAVSAGSFDRIVGSAVPVGFDSDLDYLPEELRDWFLQTSLISPAMQQVKSTEEYLRLTALNLLATRDVKLFFLWSPTYLLSLLEYVRNNVSDLLRELADHQISSEKDRVAELEMLFNGQPDWTRIWPELRLISCWADGWAAHFANQLRELFPRVPIQPKGLLATEGIVSIPQCDSTSKDIGARLCDAHFIEFLDPQSQLVMRSTELIIGSCYEIIMTTGGGFYRYRLNDIVQILGFAAARPIMRFVAKSSSVSDLCGEKLNAIHVEHLLTKALDEIGLSDMMSFLAPMIGEREVGYGVFLFLKNGYEQITDTDALIRKLEDGLCDNFNYYHCRTSGQLAPLTGILLKPEARLTYLSRKSSMGRMATVKSCQLERDADWRKLFAADICAEVRL